MLFTRQETPQARFSMLTKPANTSPNGMEFAFTGPVVLCVPSTGGKMTSTKIQIRNLYKIFGPRPEEALRLLQQGMSKDKVFERTGQVTGVNNVSFDVDAGEIFVLMGLSGSGKSTLIRLINRLVEPSAGSIIVDGEDLAKLPHNQLVKWRRQRLAMVFQSFALMPHRTVLENAAFGLEVAGSQRGWRENKAYHVLEQVGLKAYAKKYPGQLSGGM